MLFRSVSQSRYQGAEIINRLRENKRKENEEIKVNQELNLKNNEVELLEHIKILFQPIGLKSLIVSEISIIFVNKINEYLNKISISNPYKVSLELEDNIEIWIESNNKKRQFENLSSSEKMRIGIAFQCAISKITGFDSLILDDLEILDTQNKKDFFYALNQIKNDFNNIFYKI